MDGNLIETRVSDISQAAQGVKIVTLTGATERPLPRFSPGAHITLNLHDGAIVRRNSYTLLDAPEDENRYRIAVQLQPHGRGGSQFVHHRLTIGQKLIISHPLGLFSLHRLAAKHVFIAGGIGITPFLALIREAIQQGKPFKLHYTFRHRASAAFVADLETRYPGMVRTYETGRGERLDIKQIMANQPIGTHLYACGPAALIDALSELVDLRLWPRSCFHFEHFKASFSGAPFSVRLRSSGEVVNVGQHQSLLERLEDAGRNIPYMCRVGFCGRCRLTANPGDGKLIHNDQVLDDDEKAAGCYIIPCVSRFEGASMTIDL